MGWVVGCRFGVASVVIVLVITFDECGLLDDLWLNMVWV